MQQIAYTVIATFKNNSIAQKWLRWLREGHIAEVLDGGATDAEIIALDGEEKTFEVRYHFPSREAFQSYERDHAPRLRAEGIKLFPPSDGIAYRRTVGEVTEFFPRR